jgi:hypothetical protein
MALVIIGLAGAVGGLQLFVNARYSEGVRGPALISLTASRRSVGRPFEFEH